ncbi:MAG: hypothetical protein HS113_29310 [Verrucomicrobiales bacterium]|nr:hypothetical protein [Verrucomicrobiales bacterium]
MTSRTYDLVFLTPCFCAGADQTHAELRPPAIRGQLRWWFRCLGGSAAEERAIFGGVHGDNPAASIFSVRTKVQPGTGERDWYREEKIPQQGMQPKTYLLGFFCGRTRRLQPGAALPPGTKATVCLSFRRPPPASLERAVRAFFSVGALGFRATRAAGAFATSQHSLTANRWESLSAELSQAGFTVALLKPEFRDWVQLIHHAGSLLKTRLRSSDHDGLGISAGRDGTKANALGSAEPRQTSALHFRPVRVDDKLRLAVIEAPHSRILGEAAQRMHGGRGPILKLAGLVQ